MYSEFSHDPKVQMLSESMQRRYIMVMCMRCSDQLEGRTDEEVAFSLRIDLATTEETKELFIKKGFIDSDWNLLNWEKRQFTADNSVSRVQKYRANRKALGLTSNGYTKHAVTVNQRDGHACVYCGSDENLCIDHVLPTCKGGDDSIENLATACKTCNSGKAGRTPAEAGYSFNNKATEKLWLSWMESRPVTVTVTPQNRTDTDKKRVIPSLSKPSVIDCPHEKILDAFADKLPGLAQPTRSLWRDGKNAPTLKSRWAWLMTACHEKGKRKGERMATTEAEGVEWFGRFFAYVADSDFLTGRQTEWACDLIWLVNKSNFEKVIQGSYENKAKEIAA
jgi:5-methylcytosine-specific restriction endonuclease McrA